MNRIEIRNNFLKNIMLGLIYPAVLGNILYAVFKVFIQSTQSSVSDFTPKIFLLILTTLFYLCDYLYIYFTKKFKLWMFFLDIAFVVTLFFTYSKLNLEPETQHMSPQIYCILIGYLFFIVFYLIWDYFEKIKVNDKNEAKMYKRILTWEFYSIVILAANILNYKNNLFFSEYKNEISIYSIGAITISFCVLVYLKYQVWISHEISKNEQSLLKN